MNSTSEWREVSKREPCPVCGKPDWCSVIGPEGAVEAAVCMRVESNNQRDNGGWFHQLRNSSDWRPSRSTDAPRVFGTAHEAVEALERQHGLRSKVWRYYDAAGEPAGVVVRWDKSGDKIIRPISRVAGGWVIGAMREPRPLYQLADVKTANVVFVTEGEKAADAIRALGLVATTSAGGSAAASKTDWSPLAGKRVVILPDADDAGEKYARSVLSIVAGLSRQPSAKAIRLPDLPHAGDAVDWLAAGGTRDQLETLVANAQPVALSAAGSAPKAKRQPKQILLSEAAQQYINRMRDGQTGLIETGIAELDYAIGGGLEFGEMIIAAARPSHGKSAFALQCAHHWTALGLPTLIVSEEMSPLALGKRTLQFVTDVPQEHWSRSVADLERDLGDYVAGRAPCIVSEACVTPAAVVESIERAVEAHKVQAVVVDYAQLLQGQGRSRYEQVSHVSNVLRESATRFNVLLLALCQLNREIDKRAKFIPCMADIRDAGTLEQDADVILLLVWPHQVDSAQPPNKYQVFVAKNRNRPINQRLVECRFDPSRQMITEGAASAREHEYLPFT